MLSLQFVKMECKLQKVFFMIYFSKENPFKKLSQSQYKKILGTEIQLKYCCCIKI